MKLALALTVALLSCASAQPSPKEQIEQLRSRHDVSKAIKYTELPENAGYMFMAKFKSDLTDVQLVYMLGGLLNDMGQKHISMGGKVVVFAVEIPSRDVSVTADFAADEVEVWYTLRETPDVYTKKTYRGNVITIMEGIFKGTAPDPDVESGNVKDEFTRQGKREAA